ncbi:unnamed protein product [Rotaria sp. Silwood2]|nr:unnamed protein product [Rotaria sp. Silwood2]CAF2473037.1 unnamed protein product [Rotaria sp. Silwood2]CAF2704481.1 unnamed protein product [Rotaria sp. Silwood2]CAF2857057.1 unnamed protein product [Rotaria sp. Silwood2]CAF4077629.1 unnamed protein product [Rotaria sp. Silwood2]
MLCIKYLRVSSISTIALRHYAVTKTATGPTGAALKLGGGVAKKGAVITTTIQQYIDAETDPEKLVKYCCGLNYKKDQEPIEIKAVSAYPDWLFGLEKLDKIDIDQLDKDTWEYWTRYNEQGDEYLRIINEKRFPERYIPTWLKELRPLH